ncbi:non-specific lipid-transfer protein 1-like [Argentina anserina]|uniref:non-specific lipid-transfer protein 1-like n=1 Tax=Argentina anserina TaxID=57926 RepID=UPI00217663C6|nr:non-specific lipid-transfer protein 1-like [Potentilla anserina]
MTSSVASRLAIVVLMCLVVARSPLPAYAVTCGQVSQSLIPCIPYLQNGGYVPAQCCSGVRYLRNSAKTTVDHQSICRCLVAAARATRGLKLNLVAGLPNRCGVRLPYTMSPDTNCNTYAAEPYFVILASQFVAWHSF